MIEKSLTIGYNVCSMNEFYYSKFRGGECDMVDWGFSWSVVITGLVVVFVVLLLLVAVCAIMGALFSSINKSSDEKNKSVTVSVDAKPVSVVPIKDTLVIETVEDGITEEVVAAITGALTIMMSEGGQTKPFAVKSIKKSSGTRNVWNVASIQENTRSF